MSKRSNLVKDFLKFYKKRKLSPSDDKAQSSSGSNPTTAPSNPTKAALHQLRELFPLERFDFRLPPIILKHMLYSIVSNRTVVDSELESLHQARQVIFFNAAIDGTDIFITTSDDYKAHIESISHLSSCKSVIEKFLNIVLNESLELCFTRKQMSSYHFEEEDITALVQAGLLVTRDAESWWLAIPNVGFFTKTFNRGRKAVLTMVKKCKYQQILQSELEKRKLPKLAKLGVVYHVHELIGNGDLEGITTTSGVLLKPPHIRES